MDMERRKDFKEPSINADERGMKPVKKNLNAKSLSHQAEEVAVGNSAIRDKVIKRLGETGKREAGNRTFNDDPDCSKRRVGFVNV